MPIEPVDPSKKTGGDGNEKYTPNEKRGPGKFDDVLEKAKTDRVIEKEQIRKMGDALDKAGVPLPKPDTFPKTTAAFEAIAKSDAERAERKAAKASGGGGGGGMPKLNRDITKNYKAGGRVKKFNDGGMSLEEKYPGAKITRAGPQPKPVEQPPKTILQEALREVKEAEYRDLSKKAEKAPYERKAEKFEKTKGGGGGGGGIPKVGSRRPLDMKKGGSVSSASKRADGCAIRGKTRA